MPPIFSSHFHFNISHPVGISTLSLYLLYTYVNKFFLRVFNNHQAGKHIFYYIRKGGVQIKIPPPLQAEGGYNGKFKQV